MEIIVHCSDSTFGNNLLINKWHKEKGWHEIGYHFIIQNGKPFKSDEYFPLLDGSIETGRYVSNDYKEIQKGAHCKGNNEKIGICLIGKSGKFTQSQMESLKFLIDDMKQYNDIIVKQHSDYDENKPFCAGLTKIQLELLNTRTIEDELKLMREVLQKNSRKINDDEKI